MAWPRKTWLAGRHRFDRRADHSGSPHDPRTAAAISRRSGHPARTAADRRLPAPGAGQPCRPLSNHLAAPVRSCEASARSELHRVRANSPCPPRYAGNGRAAAFGRQNSPQPASADRPITPMGRSRPPAATNPAADSAGRHRSAPAAAAYRFGARTHHYRTPLGAGTQTRSTPWENSPRQTARYRPHGAIRRSPPSQILGPPAVARPHRRAHPPRHPGIGKHTVEQWSSYPRTLLRGGRRSVLRRGGCGYAGALRRLAARALTSSRPPARRFGADPRRAKTG